MGEFQPNWAKTCHAAAVQAMVSIAAMAKCSGCSRKASVKGSLRDSRPPVTARCSLRKRARAASNTSRAKTAASSSVRGRPCGANVRLYPMAAAPDSDSISLGREC